jgi:outer membrane protein TolC
MFKIFNMKKYLISLMFIFLSVHIFSQENTSVASSISDSSLNVPTLSVAIERAKQNSPLLMSSDVETVIRQLELKTTRREWLENLGFDSYYRYGSIDNINISNTATTEEISSARTFDNRFSVGIYMKLPIFDLINMKNGNKIAKQKIEQSKYEKLVLESEITKIVIKQYNEFLLYKQLLEVKNKALVSSQMQVSKANMDYKNGNLNLFELSRIIESASKSESDFFTTKMNLEVSYLLLMELIGNDKAQEQH